MQGMEKVTLIPISLLRNGILRLGIFPEDVWEAEH
jgi:hypothetical protein